MVRPWRLEQVVKHLSREGIVGMTAYNVVGAGVQGGTVYPIRCCYATTLSRRISPRP